MCSLEHGRLIGRKLIQHRFELALTLRSALRWPSAGSKSAGRETGFGLRLIQAFRAPKRRCAFLIAHGVTPAPGGRDRGDGDCFSAPAMVALEEAWAVLRFRSAHCCGRANSGDLDSQSSRSNQAGELARRKPPPLASAVARKLQDQASACGEGDGAWLVCEKRGTTSRKTQRRGKLASGWSGRPHGPLITAALLAPDRSCHLRLPLLTLLADLAAPRAGARNQFEADVSVGCMQPASEKNSGQAFGHRGRNQTAAHTVPSEKILDPEKNSL